MLFQNYKIVCVAIFVGLLCSCASPYMTKVTEADLATAPAPGKALVHFMRPSSLGGGIQAYLYDGDDYIGTVSAGTRVSYQAEPGDHVFMITGDTADFMSAELLADRVYYAVISAYPGFVTYRFAFRPMNGQVPDVEVHRWFGSTREVVINEKGRQWAEDNKDRAAAYKDAYFPKWQEKNEADRQFLKPSSGK